MPRTVSSYIVKRKGIGTPDYAAPAPVGQISIGPVATLTDLAELATRLGSIDTFDRRGNVIWMDDFESGIKHYEVLIDSAPGVFKWSSETARNGGFCGEITTPAANGDGTWIIKRLPPPVLSNIGFEVSFARWADLNNIFAQLMIADSRGKTYFAVRWLVSSEELQWRDSAGAWHSLTPRPWIASATTSWNTIKIVVDLINLQWQRATLNAATYDLSGQAGRAAGSGTPYELTGTITAYSGAAGSKITYIDDVIFTQNEPANS